ncbi:uncharacterized protein LOC110890929 isoform X1 [Helianthus annuus]|uniref:uncharacterized protein LOC110890929 isoform X1 n=1 Tax=Helianthus annuus TaxID=4232 RepID=UPI000B8F6873|nr:uncharacterized protein LOC110890929 isoform X1 [Helianthus annuus]
MANNGLKLTILFLFIITYEYCSTHVKLPTFTNTSTRSTYLIKDVFILAGQSNMAGRGGVIDKNWDGIIPPEVKPRPGKILRLGGDLTWEDAHEPLHIDIDVNKTCGVGPGMAFANAVLRGDPRRFRVVGLVPCAIGGSGIGEWSRGGRLYDELTRRAAAAGEGGGEIRGVLWFQGERDTLNISDAELYKERLRKLFIDLRTDLKSPLLPVIQSGLDPLMDAHEWNESLDRIISTIAEMIDLLKNESRRWATSPIFSTPLPSPAAASPPPTFAPVPTLPPPVSATPPTASKTASKPVLPTPTSASKSVPKQAASTIPLVMPKPTITILHTRLRKAGNSLPTEKNMILVKGVIEKREWRPPWHFTTTYPNVVGHTEWRPPWRNIKFLLCLSLRTRIVRVGWIVMYLKIRLITHWMIKMTRFEDYST